jgi:hypothetical protein
METLDAPSGTAAFNLRSQLLFLNYPQDSQDLLLSFAAQNYRFLHESNHWARFHGSSLGVLLSLLRMSRDVLAVHFLHTLTPTQRDHLAERRRAEQRMFSPTSDMSSQAETHIRRLEQDWLMLYDLYRTLLGAAPAAVGDDLVEAKTWAAGHALDLAWFQSADSRMLQYSGTHGSRLAVGPAQTEVGDGRLTTRLLFECAAVLDEMYMHTLGSLREVLDGSLWEMLSHTFDGDYGLAYRVAERLAGRDIGVTCVLALIDFALNPVVPGLYSGAGTVTWEELHPVRRFTAAARSLARHQSALEHAWPDNELIHAFYAEIEAATGLRTGRVDARLSAAASLQEAVRPRSSRGEISCTEIIPDMTLAYAKRLHEERRTTPVSLAFYGLNFVGEGALRFVNPESWGTENNWWLFPPLRVSSGQYYWPEASINMDEATDLFLGVAVSSALDDIVHGTGPLSSGHLPTVPLRDDGERTAINGVLQDLTGIQLGWNAP